MTDHAGRFLKNFLYMNVPLLYSVYSQVFEGITDEITNERIVQAITGNTEGIPLISKSTSEAVESKKTVERIVLHDHMYNLLETELRDSLNEAPTKADEIGSLSQNSLVKVSGSVEIEDYERMQTFLSRFNDLAQIIAYSGKGKEHQKQVIELLEKISLADESKGNRRGNPRSQKSDLEEQLRLLANAVPQARERGLLQDPNLLENLALFVELFNFGGYEIVFTPPDSDIRYRGILDRDWLRLSSRFVSRMYGGQSDFRWVLVGFVTHVQGTYVPLEQVALEANTGNPMMLDAYRNMFRSSRFFERMFLESNSSTEVAMEPLAIYREVSI